MVFAIIGIFGWQWGNRGERSTSQAKVLLTTPNLEKAGGVANYYATLKAHFNNEVEYFTVGSRFVGERFGHKWTQLLKDYRRFYRTLKSGCYDLVHLNPSLTSKAIVQASGLWGFLKKVLGLPQ